MENNGYIKLFRKSKENFLYRENRPHTRREAWEDILLMVNHTDKEILIGNEKFLVERGQSLRSLDSWAKEFNWSKSKVKRFFDLLKRESMIVTQSVRKSTRLTVCNYEDYQGGRNANETQMKRERPTNKNEKNEKNNKGDKSESFQTFWDTYHQTTGKQKTDKESAFKHWKKLTAKEQTKAIEAIKPYFHSLNDPKFCKKARTYLADKNFNDEFQSTPRKQLTSYPLIK